jgi:hypothetical protein
MVFRNTDTGVPDPGLKSDSASGMFVNFLDKCLVTGFGGASISSITRSGSVVTVVTATAHGLAPTLQTYRYVLIAGVEQTEYNGTFKATIINTTTFTYPITTTPISPGTSSTAMTVKIAPAGWTKPFTGTNSAAFKQPAGSNGMYLFVEDTVGINGLLYRGYETMSNIGTGTNPFPAGAYLSWYKWSTSGIDWVFITNGKFFYFISLCSYTSYYSYWVIAFGDFTSYLIAPDNYNTILIGNALSTQACNFMCLGNGTGRYIARSWAQTGAAFSFANWTDGISGAYIGGQGFSYPEPNRNAFIVSPVYINDGCKRGVLPGFLNPLHAARIFADLDFIQGTGDYAGRLYLYKYLGGSNAPANTAALFEVSDTW